MTGMARLTAAIGLALLLSACETAQQQIEREFGYPTVAAAFEALKARKDVKMTSHEGWTIIEDPVNSTLWSFVPADHPAYPAVIRRQMLDRNGGKVVEMSALCQAPRAACDKLVDEMRAASEPPPPAEKPAAAPPPKPEAR